MDEYRYWTENKWMTEKEMRKLERKFRVKLQSDLEQEIEFQNDTSNKLTALLNKEEKLAKE